MTHPCVRADPRAQPPQVAALPKSLVYKMSSEAFSRPLLEPMVSWGRGGLQRYGEGFDGEVTTW